MESMRSESAETGASPLDVAAPSSSSTTMEGSRAMSMAIIMGKTMVESSASSASSGDCSSSSIPMVVWIQMERTRQSPTDPWKYVLEYYEFLDDPARWTHLDQLILKWAPRSVSLGTSESLETKDGNNAKQRRLERLVESLQVFLDERLTNDNENNEEEKNDTACQLFTQVPVDPSHLEQVLTRLLLDDASVQLAYRGNLQLSTSTGSGSSNNNSLVQQGLALWLQSQQLYGRKNVLGDCDKWEHSLTVQKGVLKSHLVLDHTAAQCIHLLPPANAGVATVVGGQMHNNSLWGLLSKPCLTSMGKSQLQLWLRQPLIDKSAILKRQDAVTDLMGLGKDAIRDALKTFSGVDLPQLANTLGSYSPNDTTAEDGTTQDNPTSGTSPKKALQALYQLYLLASMKLPQLLDALSTLSGTSSSSLLQQLQIDVVQLVRELERCQGLVEAVLDLDQAPREYLIKPTFSPELQELYQELQSIQDAVDEELASMQQIWAQTVGTTSSKASQVRLESQSDDSSWHFRLPNTNDTKTLQTLGSKIQVHRLLKNGVYFSTLQLRQLSAQYQDVRATYDRHSQQIVQDAMAVATTYQTVVSRTTHVVSTLDVLCSLAYVADYRGYCKPSLTDSDEDGAGITLKEARHPCVELQDDMTEYISNDISLLFGKSNFLLVTGPNMGGKSTYIRSLGAIVCLAQIGSYVPCKAATINICHAILARVGAGDLQERGISTFMAEMLEASSILRTATKRSLIIIDELGRGTSTFDGYGLARAISEYIQQRIGCMAVFATHFHELTQLPNVKNCHVTAQKGHQGLTFLYAVRPGPCLESFGIQVAEMANVPSCVIEDAKRKAKALEHFDKSSKRSKATTDAFVERFRSINVPDILDDTSSSIESKRAQLLELLSH